MCVGKVADHSRSRRCWECRLPALTAPVLHQQRQRLHTRLPGAACKEAIEAHQRKNPVALFTISAMLAQAFCVLRKRHVCYVSEFDRDRQPASKLSVWMSVLSCCCKDWLHLTDSLAIARVHFDSAIPEPVPLGLRLRGKSLDCRESRRARQV